MINYIDLNTIYSNHSFGEFTINIDVEKSITSKTIKDFYNVTNEYENFSDVYLFKKGEIVMCSTEMELLTNKPFIDNVIGDVLIVGLGLGMVVFPLLNEDSITSITIIEKELDLINFVGFKISEMDTNNKVTILMGDAYNHYERLAPNKKYDTIFLDFWNQIDMSNVDEVTSMKQYYSPFLKNETSKIISWCEDIKELLIKTMNP
jgi:hypothetical protein